MGAYTRVAYISKPKSLNGWVVCHAADGFPFALNAGLTVHFVPPSMRGPRNAVVAEVRPVRFGVWDVRFEGIATPEDAQQISGCICLALSEELDNPEESSSAFDQVVGYTLVESAAGVVGPIVAIQPGPAQDWLVVESARGEVLVPAVDAFLGAIDQEAHILHATLPNGLLNLAQGQDSVEADAGPTGH